MLGTSPGAGLTIGLIVALALPMSCADTGESAFDPALPPSGGAFVAPVVAGLEYTAAAHWGLTDPDGRFDCALGEDITFHIGPLVLGGTAAAREVTVLDLGERSQLDSPDAIGRTRVLVTLDRDADATNGVQLHEGAARFVSDALDALGVTAIDFEHAFIVDAFIDALCRAAEAHGVTLAAATRDEGLVCLSSALEAADQFLTNPSGTPTLASMKGKLDLVLERTAGRTASGDATGEQVLPIVVAYNDEVPGTGGKKDAFVAVSLDEGATWRRTNVSLSAYRGSYWLPDGRPSLGDTTKCSVQVKGRYIFATWTSTYCPDPNPMSLTAEEDIYGVAGEQRAVDYALQGYFDVGIVPYRCLWAARGFITPSGTVTYTMPEQITAGVRDALQNFTAGQKGVGFAVAWQEDPEGLKPGSCEGPGHGWSGATTNHGTDIWYSALLWEDFWQLDPNYEPAYDDQNPDGRPTALIPMLMPVRVTDNNACKYTDLYDDPPDDDTTPDLDPLPTDLIPFADGGQQGPIAKPQLPHSKRPDWGGLGLEDGPHGQPSGGDNQDNTHRPEHITYPYCVDYCVAPDPNGFCVTDDGRVLAGRTGASRPNLNLVPKTLPDGTKTGIAVLAYEETKGLKNTDPTEEGKIVRFHSFDPFIQPNPIAVGDPVNLPNAAGHFENARRVRIIVQPKANAGPSGTVMVLLYKQGEEGQGRPSDIFMRRAVGGYSYAHLLPDVANISSVVPLPSDRACGMDWEWSEANLYDASFTNPLDDARAHRGQLRGDFLLVGYTWTPNWYGATSGTDKYDLLIRRSFDGGQTFTNAAGEISPPLNLTALPNCDSTVIEPRIVGTPGTVTNPDGTPTGHAEDVRDPHVFFFTYGTATNNPLTHSEIKVPQDLYWVRTSDQGESFEWDEMTDPDTGEVLSLWRVLADGPTEQGECQIRMTPSGTRFYATWADEDAQVSDILFRRITFDGEL